MASQAGWCTGVLILPVLVGCSSFHALWLQVQLCLVINKIDRLIQEWRMQPQEAYDRIRAIVAHVNMIVSAFQSERFISDADAVLAYEDARASAGQAPRYTLVPAGFGV